MSREYRGPSAELRENLFAGDLRGFTRIEESNCGERTTEGTDVAG
jgi:hypothetical protein